MLKTSKPAFLVLLFLIFNINSAYSGVIDKNCTFKGVKLNGRVKIVESFPTFEVKKVKAFGDLYVEFVNNFPTECGQWQIVDNFEDFSVKFVEHFEDFSIEESKFPGVG